MADEQAQEVVEPQEDIQPAADTATQEPLETQENVSEDDQNTSKESDRGDLGVALKQEREKRQQLEQSLRDPNFIYNQARQLGLTEEEAQQQVDAATAPTTSSAFNPSDIQSQVKRAMEMEKTIDKYPQLAKDREDQILVSALIDSGLSPLKAAEKFYSRFEKTKEEAKTEGATQAKQEISDRQRAQTAVSGSPAPSQSAESEDLQRRMKSVNSKVQREAMTEWLKQRNRKQ